MLSKLFPRGVSADTVSFWFGRLYRIEVDELQELLRERYQVHIVGMDHKFRASLDKLGSRGKLILVSFPSGFELPSGLLTKASCVSLYGGQTTCLLVYKTPSQTFRVAFEGVDDDSIRSWCKELKRGLPFYLSMFLYVFNRFRASRALERRRDEQRLLLVELSRGLREEDGAQGALGLLARRAGFDWVVVFVCDQIEHNLVPLASSNPKMLDRLREVPLQNLSYHEELFGERGNEAVSASIERDKRDCNCRLLHKLGARSAVYVPFGWEAEGKGRPRGVLACYRRSRESSTPDELVLLRVIGREIAGWVNEIDELVERTIIEESIQAAEARCHAAEPKGIDETLLPLILSDVERHLQKGLSALPLPARVGARLQIGLLVERKVIGHIPDDILTKLSALRQPTLLEGAAREAAVVWCEPRMSFWLVVVAPRKHLGLLRGRLYASLYLVLKLVYRLILVERRRTVWTLRTIHEIRQPLQGLIAVADEIRRLSGLASVSRSELGHWAEDMVTGVYRLKVLLRFSEHLAGIERIVPNPREMLIEGDVLRLARRLLTGLAASRQLSIGQTVAYELIPRLECDPELLTEIFYNLLQNAIKYSEPGSEIAIVCGRSEDEYYVEVRNMGPEIYSDECSEIFVDGHRGRNARKMEGGMGIGLPVSRALARHMGCRIELTSRGEADQAVAFRVYIPKGSET